LNKIKEIEETKTKILNWETTEAEILGYYGTETKADRTYKKAVAIRTELKPLTDLALSLHYTVSLICDKKLLASECLHYPIREIRLGIKDAKLENLDNLRFCIAHEIGHIQLLLEGFSEDNSIKELFAALSTHTEKAKMIEVYAWIKALEVLKISLEPNTKEETEALKKFLALSQECINTYIP